TGEDDCGRGRCPRREVGEPDGVRLLDAGRHDHQVDQLLRVAEVLLSRDHAGDPVDLFDVELEGSSNLSPECLRRSDRDDSGHAPAPGKTLPIVSGAVLLPAWPGGSNAIQTEPPPDPLARMSFSASCGVSSSVI